ncbi:MAG: biphenyl 2,3-dioxygenase [Candidatus Rokuibacteriota bacterium]|nr:MAG: biphenyl 2,3-dioxygenase [Candidatus Rokubacteria bacterium]
MNTVATATRTLPASSQRIVPEKFAHVVLKTANYDAVIAWYATVLQAPVAFRNDFIAFLTYDDEHHRVAVLNTPGSPAPDPAAAGVHHIAYTYTGLGELLATYRRLKASGIEPARCINHGPTTSMYYRDPDGLRVELQIDNFATIHARGNSARGRLDNQVSREACRSGASSRSRPWRTVRRSLPWSSRAGCPAPLRCARPRWGWSPRRPAYG